VASHGNSWQWWAEHEREQQALALVRRIDQLIADQPAHVLIGGDVTAGPQTASVRFLTGRESPEGYSTAYRDCWESVHGEGSSAASITGRRWASTTAAWCSTRRWTETFPSDHYAVLADLSPADTSRTLTQGPTSSAGGSSGRRHASLHSGARTWP
jgi:endonuclease/exonuclease/phosphatase family metal-dependent hydrolase